MKVIIFTVPVTSCQKRMGRGGQCSWTNQEGRTDSGRIPGHYVKYTKRCMESYFRVRGLLVAQGCQKGDCEDKSLQASLMCSTDGRGIYKNHTRSSFLIKFWSFVFKTDIRKSQICPWVLPFCGQWSVSVMSWTRQNVWQKLTSFYFPFVKSEPAWLCCEELKF